MYSCVGLQPFVQACILQHTTGSETEMTRTHAGTRICGAGIVGAATAYHLTLRGLSPIVVESTTVAAAASGKAGGFLAGGWGDGGVTEALHRKGAAPPQCHPGYLSLGLVSAVHLSALESMLRVFPL